MKHQVVPVMDQVSLLISVWLPILVKMVVHVLLLVMAVVMNASVNRSILDSTVKVQSCIVYSQLHSQGD